MDKGGNLLKPSSTHFSQAFVLYLGLSHRFYEVRGLEDGKL